MTFGKRQLVIAALVTALGAAVYLNWQFSSSVPVEVAGTEESSQKQLGQTTYVNTEPKAAQASEDKEKKETVTKKDAQQANAQPSAAEVFDSERKKRSESNAEAAETLTEIAESADSSDKAKEEAAQAAKKLAETIKVQTDLETLIASKGFDDVYVAVNNDNCTVLVSGGKLDDAVVLGIRDAVNRQAGIDFDKITVSQSGKESV